MGICLIVKSGGGVDTSTATATADKILSGYTLYSNDNKITGNMANIGTQTTSGLNVGTSVTINAGWHNGSGTVITNTLSSQTSADIPDASWCLYSYTYWKNGVKYTGTMGNIGAKSWSIGANGSQTIEGGWHNGSGTVKQSINVDNGEWGPNPTTTNQQLCWQGWYYSKNRWCWGNGNLTSGNIKKGISIFGVTGNYYETKRYIIQNGASTGLCTTTSHSSDTMSWGGSTWKLLVDVSWSYIDSDEGSDYESYWNMGITAFNSMFARENKSEYAAKFGFTIGMDTLMYAYNGDKWSYTVSPMVYAKYITRKGNSSRWPMYVVFYMSTYTISNTTWTPGTILATGKGDTGNSSDGVSGAPIGTMWFDYKNGPATYQHSRCGVYVWVKNLWFDLSSTLSYGY